MNLNQQLSQDYFDLPNIDFIECSEQAFGGAFLRAAKILCRHLEQIRSAIEVMKDFRKEPLSLMILGLFSNMCRHYYSYVLLEINHDQIGSQLLIEHLDEDAITLTYLLEEGDKDQFSEYICASVHQARYLLIAVEEQLQKFPAHPDLLKLKIQLDNFLTKQQELVAHCPLTGDSEAYLWGPQEANTTAKRGAIMGLNFLTNPARQIALKVKPASGLELELSYLNSFANISRTQADGINFTNLRDAAHLCLHATQALIEEVVNYQGLNLQGIERQRQMLNALYEWFHKAHKLYQLQCCAKN